MEWPFFYERNATLNFLNNILSTLCDLSLDLLNIKEDFYAIQEMLQQNSSCTHHDLLSRLCPIAARFCEVLREQQPDIHHAQRILWGEIGDVNIVKLLKDVNMRELRKFTAKAGEYECRDPITNKCSPTSTPNEQLQLLRSSIDIAVIPPQNLKPVLERYSAIPKEVSYSLFFYKAALWCAKCRHLWQNKLLRAIVFL